MFTARVCLTALLALLVIGGPISVEAHTTLFHGTEAGAAHVHCHDHVHAVLENAHDAGLDHPVCVTHPPATALRLAVGTARADADLLPNSLEKTFAIGAPETRTVASHRSRAPPPRG